MGLLSFLKRSAGEPSTSRNTPRSAEPGDVDRARTRARQRLIGAAVLVGIGVVGFPILFDTQPRPLPVDIPIDIPAKDAAPALAVPKPRAGGAGVSSSSRPTPAPSSTPAPVVASEGTVPREPVAAPTPAPEPTPRPTPTPKPAEKVADRQPSESKPAAKDSARAQALLEGRDASPAAAGAGRFVVQVGAFGDANAARDVRQKVEKLGLKTYTQVVDTSGGKRIRVRVGPYDERAEAEKVVAKLKQAGLAPALLTL
jgi:DedD protein